jgi:HK97 gp10 family phage protein
MEFKTEIKISPELLKLGNNLEAGIQAGLLRAAGVVEAADVAEAPVRTGNLADRIRKYLEGRRAHIVSTAPYSIHVHQGTGIYGPHKTKIVPTTKKALAFQIGGKTLIRRSVKGQKANPFMTRGLNKVERRLPDIFGQAIQEYLAKKRNGE